MRSPRAGAWRGASGHGSSATRASSGSTILTWPLSVWATFCEVLTASWETEAVTLRSLQKWHGAGNDFLIAVVHADASPWWNSSHARAACQRATGVGADGLIVATLGTPVSMVLYNG